MNIPHQQKTIQTRFEDFHRANPWICAALIAKARKAKQRGYTQIGIAFLVEIIRWEDGGTTVNQDGFKISNDFRSRYARLIMTQEPDLADFFTTRHLESE